MKNTMHNIKISIIAISLFCSLNDCYSAYDRHFNAPQRHTAQAFSLPSIPSLPAAYDQRVTTPIYAEIDANTSALMPPLPVDVQARVFKRGK